MGWSPSLGPRPSSPPSPNIMREGEKNVSFSSVFFLPHYIRGGGGRPGTEASGHQNRLIEGGEGCSYKSSM